MTSTAADLVDHVLPDVPLRQLVLTLPFELRARVAYDGELLGAVTRTFVDSVLGWYQRQMRARAVPGGKSGAVTVVQRVNSDLRLSPHLHSLFLDGVFAEDEGGELVFHPLPFLTNDDVGDVLQVARARASKWRARVVPPPPQQAMSRSDDNTDCKTDCATCSPKTKDKPPTHRSGYRPWRELLMRAFKIDVEKCDKCGGRMKLRALVMTAAGIERYLAWLGEPSDPPRLAPARAPPYFKHPAIRRRLGEPVQAELFGAH